MTIAVGLVIILVIKVKTFTSEDLYYNNGWKPLSHEMILERLHRKMELANTVPISDVHWNPILVDDKFGHIQGNTDVKPDDINSELLDEDYNYDIGIDEKHYEENIKDKGQSYNNDLLLNDTKMMHKPSTNYRRMAKNIIQSQENVNNATERPENKNDIFKNIMPDDVNMKEAAILNGKSNIYEVTEVSEASKIKDLLDPNQGRIDEGKPYFKHNFETTTEKSLSNKLLSILGNYNIRINDDLTNYDLSRSKHISNYRKQSHVYSAPRVPMRNSQNYFPIDPLLAVFLSNYGYYLPGLYGFPGNYYNIYGYLASNNIHNNKPFGAYKIFSDTDSSH